MTTNAPSPLQCEFVKQNGWKFNDGCYILYVILEEDKEEEVEEEENEASS